jgi:hypothetical protein
MDHEEPKDTEMVAEDIERPEDLDDDDDDLPEGVMGEQLDSVFQDSKEAQMMVQQAQKEYTEHNLFKVYKALPMSFQLIRILSLTS